jgi:hypothetical protein
VTTGSDEQAFGLLTAVAVMSERLLEWLQEVRHRPGVESGRHGFDLRLFNRDTQPVVDILAYVELSVAGGSPATWSVSAQWNGVEWEIEGSVVRQSAGEEQKLFSTGVERGVASREFVETLNHVVKRLLEVPPRVIGAHQVA